MLYEFKLYFLYFNKFNFQESCYDQLYYCSQYSASISLTHLRHKPRLMGQMVSGSVGQRSVGHWSNGLVGKMGHG